MKVNSYEKPLTLRGEEGAELRVQPSSMGEPYRAGISVQLDDGSTWVTLFLEASEARSLHKFLTGYLNAGD